MHTLRNKVRLLAKAAVISLAITMAVIFHKDSR